MRTILTAIRTSRRNTLLLAAAALAFAIPVLALTLPANAAPKTAAVVAHRTATATATATASATVACWTTFNPPTPQGAPMDQTYKNCNTYDIYVAPGYSYQGQVNLGVIACARVPANSYLTWHWASTQPNAQYTTVVCRYPA
jgi:hypothetical protein